MNTENITLQGIVKQPVTLPIGLGPATGYVWKLKLPANVEQTEDKAGEPEAKDKRVGGGSNFFFQVIATQPGSYTIEATLARPWEAKPVSVMQIKLEISGV